jgi:hypothetical protein
MMISDTNLGITPAASPVGTKISRDVAVEFENEVRRERSGVEGSPSYAALDEKDPLGQ